MDERSTGCTARPRAASRALATLALTGLLGGCAWLGFDGRGDRADGMPDPDIVAQNLVYTLAQVPGLNPLQTTVQVSEPTTGYGERVLARLEEAGYGLQRVTADQGANFVRYRAERAETERGERIRYGLTIGETSVERDYDVVDGETVPSSPPFVHGVERLDLVTNDEILFGEDVPAELSTVGFAMFGEPPIIDLVGAPGFETDVAPRTDVIELAAARATTASDATVPASFAASVRRNMYETMRSNYADLFAYYEDIEQNVLVFPNDSLELGEANKAVIARYVQELDPATDVLSVIGCSHGRTAIDNGNELLAIGRANRVKEAFVFAGISHDQVLEEACWAPQHFDEVMPRRGVVLTLKRLRGLG